MPDEVAGALATKFVPLGEITVADGEKRRSEDRRERSSATNGLIAASTGSLGIGGRPLLRVGVSASGSAEDFLIASSISYVCCTPTSVRTPDVGGLYSRSRAVEFSL